MMKVQMQDFETLKESKTLEEESLLPGSATVELRGYSKHAEEEICRPMEQYMKDTAQMCVEKMFRKKALPGRQSEARHGIIRENNVRIRNGAECA